MGLQGIHSSSVTSDTPWCPSESKCPIAHVSSPGGPLPTMGSLAHVVLTLRVSSPVSEGDILKESRREGIGPRVR